MENRKQYLFFTAVAFVAGFLFFGVLVFVNHSQLDVVMSRGVSLLLCGFLGGWLIAGLLSGVLIFARLIKTQQVFVKVMSIVFFPITLAVIVQGGFFSFFPYWIYSMFKLTKKA